MIVSVNVSYNLRCQEKKLINWKKMLWPPNKKQLKEFIFAIFFIKTHIALLEITFLAKTVS
jgi:hypothetical protein